MITHPPRVAPGLPCQVPGRRPRPAPPALEERFLSWLDPGRPQARPPHPADLPDAEAPPLSPHAWGARPYTQPRGPLARLFIALEHRLAAVAAVLADGLGLVAAEGGDRVARRRRLLLGSVGYLGLVLLAAAQGFNWSERRELARLDDAALHQLDLYAAVLDVELSKQSDLPGLIDTDAAIALLVHRPDAAGIAQVNQRLGRFVARSGALWAGVVDERGEVVGSSRWYRPDQAFVRALGKDPCVADSLAGRPAQRFVPDEATGAPEVCFARPVLHEGRTAGAVVVRISLEPIEVTWIDAAFRSESERPLVVDANGTVVMSSVPAWRGRLLGALMSSQRPLGDGVELVRIKPEAGGSGPAGVGGGAHAVVGMSVDGLVPTVPGMGPEGVTAAGVKGLGAVRTPELQVLHERPLPRFGWRLMVLSSAHEVWRDARAAAWISGALAATVGLLMMLILQRRRVVAQKLAARAALQRVNDELEAKVQQRTAELEASNRELRREVVERQHAEQVLRRAQEELVQAGKLALLGQLSAGISHELGQPLTALRALAQNGRLLIERGRSSAAAENFAAVLGLAERMGHITSQLKSFARKSPARERSQPLREIIDNARVLLDARLAQQQVRLRIETPPGLSVQCDGYRLEQVLVNLMANAVDAMRESQTRVITVHAHTLSAAPDARVLIRVTDTGPGIPPALGQRLFEPFFTTKPPGEGLGLGLVISSHIVREFGGALRWVPSVIGAVFEFDLAQGEPCLTDTPSP